MSTKRVRSLQRLSIFAVLAGLTLLPVLAVPAASAPRAAVYGSCDSALPAATDGQLTLDRTLVRPGSYALAYVSGFRQWPQGLVGGGSGETFLSCTPWVAGGHAEVMVHDSAGFFRFLVPTGTAPGSYTVSVLFNEGSTQTMDYSNTRRLSARLTVSSNAPSTTTSSAACRLSHAAAGTGSLQAPASARPGTSVNVAVRGVSVGYLNEYGGRLTFVACLGGNATAVMGSVTSFSLPVPSNLASGDYDIAVTGASTGEMHVVTWTRRIHVQVAPPPAPSSTPAPATTTAQASTSAAPSSSVPTSTAAPSTSAVATTTAGPSPSIPAASSLSASKASAEKQSSSGTGPWLLGALAIVLLGAGGSLIWFRMHHRPGA